MSGSLVEGTRDCSRLCAAEFSILWGAVSFSVLPSSILVNVLGKDRSSKQKKWTTLI